MHPYIRFAAGKQAEMIAALKEMVECESPSDSPVHVNRFVDLLVEKTRNIASASVSEAQGSGRNLRLEFKLGDNKTNGRILGLGHSDTVWPLGTLSNMPFRRDDNKVWGPGVLDMKAGLLLFIYAVRTLEELNIPVNRRIVLLVSSDEETGSVNSRELIETEARTSDFVLVVEPGEGTTGKLKTARKGVGNYKLVIEGQPAHSGVNFDEGASAIVEAARQIQKIAEWTDLKSGITVNPGIISGGTRKNVVAARAEVEFDVRAVRLEDFQAVDQKFRSLRSADKNCSVRVEGGMNRPPMERSHKIAGLFAKAHGIAEQLGMNLEESSSGGGSDGSFTAALGVPTLDGLGAVGEGAHALKESVLIDRLADRTALLAALLAGL